MNKPQLTDNKLHCSANRNGGNWTLIYQPDLRHSGEKVSLFDNHAGEEHIIVSDEDYQHRKTQVLENEGKAAAEKWELDSPYCTHNFVSICLGVAHKDELDHLKAVWQALTLLATIR